MLDGDIDRLVELLGGDLTGTYQFIRVAEVMLELGRDDDTAVLGLRRAKQQQMPSSTTYAL